MKGFYLANFGKLLVVIHFFHIISLRCCDLEGRSKGSEPQHHFVFFSANKTLSHEINLNQA